MSRVQDIALEVATLVERKNADYDKSFEKTVAKYGPVAYCLRIDDKLSRFHALAVKGNCQKVEDEKITDTVRDIIGYSLLLLDLLENTNDK